MKIDTEFLEDHQVKIQVEVEPVPFEEAKQRAARRIAKKTKIPGFRPGKAPYPVVVRYIGEPAILEEAMEILIDELYPKVLEEAKIEPYGSGTLENLNIDPPTLNFLIPLKPSVELGDYRGVRIPYNFPGVSDEEFESTIDNLRSRQVILEPVERPVQEGDQVYIQISGIRLNPKEDQDNELIKERESTFIIKPESTDEAEFPFTGFSRELIGLSVGDEKTISYTYPENDRYTDLVGVQAEFHIKVKEVKSRTLPELNDEFAQSMGDFSTYDDLQKAVKNMLEEQSKQSFNQEYDDKVLNEIVSISTIKYPPQLLEKEIDRAIDNLKSRLAQQHMDIDLYLKSRNIDLASFREEIKPESEERLKKSLVLFEINDIEKIDIDKDELQTETSRTLSALHQYLPEKQIRKITRSQDSMSNIVGNIMFDMMTQKTIEKIRAIASGQEEQIPEEQTTVEDKDKKEVKTKTIEAAPSPVEDNTQTEVETDTSASSPSPEAAPAAKPKRSKSKKKVEEK